MSNLYSTKELEMKKFIVKSDDKKDVILEIYLGVDSDENCWIIDVLLLDGKEKWSQFFNSKDRSSYDRGMKELQNFENLAITNKNDPENFIDELKKFMRQRDYEC